MSAVDVSLIVPAFDEAERLPTNLEKILGYVKSRQGEDWQVIVVDDGSRDETAERARGFGDQLEVISYQPNRGKGYAVRQGVKASRGRLVLFSDADLSAPLEEWTRLREALPKGGVAVGSRAVDPSLIRDRQPFYRQAMGKTFNLIVQAVAMAGVKDTQCGFKLFDGDLARIIFPLARIDRFAFDVELLVLARRFGAEVAEVPVVWNHVPASRVHPIRDSARMFVDVCRIRWLHRRTRP